MNKPMPFPVTVNSPIRTVVPAALAEMPTPPFFTEAVRSIITFVVPPPPAWLPIPTPAFPAATLSRTVAVIAPVVAKPWKVMPPFPEFSTWTRSSMTVAPPLPPGKTKMPFSLGSAISIFAT